MTGDRVVQVADASGQAEVLRAGRDVTWVEGDLAPTQLGTGPAES